MKRCCLGIKKNLHRCSRTGDWLFFCYDHIRQPIVWVFIFVFTVLSGGASIYSVIESTFFSIRSVVEPKASVNHYKAPPLSLNRLINNENLIVFAIVSDVDLVSIFDPLALEHRFRDKKDWWIDNAELIREMNRGNGIFISTGYDGYYEVIVHGEKPRIESSVISMNLVCEGGLIYIGGYPNDGLDKIESPFGGDYFSCDKGIYQVEIRVKSNIVDLSFSSIEKFSRNYFKNIPHFDEF